jgi:hypothetical protein
MTTAAANTNTTTTTLTTPTNVSVTKVNIAAQKATVEAQYKALIAGINAELTADQQFIINGETLSKAALLARFQARLDAAQKTKADRTTLTTTVDAERRLQLEVTPLRTGFKVYLLSRYGKSSPELQKFGFTQTKRPQRPVASKAAGVAKSKATRAARGTAGKKAKLAIKGTVAQPGTAAPPAPTPPAAAPPAPPKAPITPNINPNPGGSA